MKHQIYQSGIFVHVIAGILALVFGFAAFAVRKKGGKIHNISGSIFYWSMLIIFITTLLFFILEPLRLKYQFFLTIGIVGFYPTWSAKRVLSMKKAVVPCWQDTAAAYLIGISGIVMLIYGIYGTINPKAFQGLQTLFLIFGILSLFNAYGDLKIYLGHVAPKDMHWFFAHGGKMTGAYAAAVTAFCVNIVPRYLPTNSPSFVYILTWVLPGVLVGVVGNRMLKHYRTKLRK